jgi:ribosome-associated protein
VTELTTLTDYFVICSVDSQPQLSAVTDEIGKVLGKKGIQPLGIEGAKGSHWVLLDYDDVIVHLFRKEERAFYNLDGLWGDAPKIDLEVESKPAGKKRRIG